ncbi:hypothetical protein PMAYCL1PPCAC_28553, partial [Pristionchus mayeri]
IPLITMHRVTILLLLSLGTANGLSCWETNDKGETVISSDPSYKFCALIYVGGHRAKLLGMSDDIERMSTYEGFLVNTPAYKVTSTCFSEAFDFAALGLGGRWTAKGPERITRCMCRDDLCNGHKTIAGFLGI